MNGTVPIVQLTFYSDAIFCTRYDAQGQTTYPVAPQEVAEAVGKVTFSTGWLPPRTLFVARRGGVTTVALHVPAGYHRVSVETMNGPALWTIPMPDLLFIGQGNAYFVFATRSTPTPDAPLFHAPCPNVHDNGSICAGTTPFPEATPETMQSTFALFMHHSTFTLHLSRDRVTGRAKANILTLWQALAARPRARFPSRRLRPLSTTIAALLP